MVSREDSGMFMGKSTYKICTSAAVLGLLFGASLFAIADSLVIKTADGKVHGKLLNAGKIRAFEGIPYAAPTVGDLRWKAPQPAKPWKQELDATKYGPHCAQGQFFDDMVFQDNGMSEDCLSLNVYTPAA